MNDEWTLLRQRLEEGGCSPEIVDFAMKWVKAIDEKIYGGDEKLHDAAHRLLHELKTDSVTREVLSSVIAILDEHWGHGYLLTVFDQRNPFI